MLQGDTPFLLQHKPPTRSAATSRRERAESQPNKRPGDKQHDRSPRKEAPAEKGMERFRIEVGHSHGVQPGNIVGAIANEAGIESQYIGRINIHDDYSLVDLPEGMPKEIFNDLKYVWVAGQQLRISRLSDSTKPRNSTGRPKDKSKSKAKGRGKNKRVAKRQPRKKTSKS
jgi:ATP-dependent RNA helicase DeaD